MAMKIGELNRNEENDMESNVKSPEIRAFFALVDREAHRVRLLNKKKQNSKKPSMNNCGIWEPSFELEDFRAPSGSIENCPRTERRSDEKTNEGEKEEKIVKAGIKRPRELANLSPLVVCKETRLVKSPINNGGVIDLNMEDESIHSARYWTMWFKD